MTAIKTKEQIASLASLMCGGSPISDLSSDTRESQLFGGLIDYAYETLLTSATWNFAIRTQQLSLLADAPDDRWFAYQFELPTDYLKVREVTDSGGTPIASYRIEGDTLITDVDECWMKYSSQPDFLKLPPWFTDVLVKRLAALANPGLTGISSDTERLTKLAEDALKRARIADGNEGQDTSYEDIGSPFLGGRA